MEVVNGALTRQSREEEEDQEDQEDTWVFPLVQMKPLGIQVDEQVTQVRGHMMSSAWSDWPFHSYTNTPARFQVASLLIH